jgi:lipid II:glycine glycyltransferase (peptidoglycan interpeptide bridge formation enzyme)
MTWDTLVAKHENGHFLQTSAWGRLKADFGWDWETVTVGDPPHSGALILYRDLPLGVGTLAYVPRGPVVAWEETRHVGRVVAAIEAAARRRGAWAVWLEPSLRDTPAARAQLQALGLRSSARKVQPPRTILVDLTASEDEILARMKSKTRYNIRLSGRKDVTVREGTLKDVDTFNAMMEVTGDRDEFGIRDAAYYRRALELFLPPTEPPGVQAALLIAEFEGEPLAALVALAVGRTAWYWIGASSNRHRNRMPTYALQWAAMRWARARGCTVYDMWGIPDADEETLENQFLERSDGLWGVYRFKRGFGGEVVRYAGLWEQALHPLYRPAAWLGSRVLGGEVT